jgi:hypothetical protein
MNSAIEKFMEHGYAVLPSMINLSVIDETRQMAEKDAVDIPIDPDGGLPWAYDVFASDYGPLIRSIDGVFSRLGSTGTSVSRVTIINKVAHESRRFWHSDLDGTPMCPPDQILALTYLRDTNDNSGCLVVVPGCYTGPAHKEHVVTAHPDEVEVPVHIGDVVLMDPRLQHASLPNHTDTDRLMVRLWINCKWGEA